MPGILAIETSTDACSLATLIDGVTAQRHIVAPRRHNQLIFSLLEDLVAPAELRPENFSAIAYGNGPGSFTGLRIAASAVQGLSYASGIPAVGISTLAALSQRALREGVVNDTDTVCAVLDASIGEVYAALYRFESGSAVLEAGPWARKPELLELPLQTPVHLVGNGALYLSALPEPVQSRILTCNADLSPMARDVATLAALALENNNTQLPAEVQPVYVRDEISWKKLADQGKQA